MNILYCNTRWDGNQLNTIIRQSINDELTDNVVSVSEVGCNITIEAESIEHYNQQLFNILLDLVNYIPHDKVNYKHLQITKQDIPKLVENNLITYLE